MDPEYLDRWFSTHQDWPAPGDAAQHATNCIRDEVQTLIRAGDDPTKAHGIIARWIQSAIDASYAKAHGDYWCHQCEKWAIRTHYYEVHASRDHVMPRGEP